MKSKNYYKQLSRNWFEASITPAQERRLKQFLAGTEDPDFNQIKAVMGFFECGKALNRPFKRTVAIRWRAAVAAVAAASIAIVSIGARQAFNRSKLASMEATLTDIFSSGADVETELGELFNDEL